MSKKITTTSNIQEANNIAQKLQKENQLKDLTATLVIEGNPMIKADMVIEVEGVLGIHSGKWYVEKVTHNISKSGYITTLELNKNATRKPITTQTTQLNTINNKQNFPTKPPPVDNPKTIQRYDGYGKPIK
jgi:phage protein D